MASTLHLDLPALAFVHRIWRILEFPERVFNKTITLICFCSRPALFIDSACRTRPSIAVLFYETFYGFYAPPLNYYSPRWNYYLSARRRLRWEEEAVIDHAIESPSLVL